MTAFVLPRLRRPHFGRASVGSPPALGPLPPLSPGLELVRAVLVVVSVLSACVVGQLVIVSPLQQRAAQQHAFDRLRSEIASGTAPLTGADLAGRLGDPVAYLEVPTIGLRQVVVEGTTAGALFTGPGHRRDTALPGQAGVSVVLGRRAAFGGPFARLDELEPGDVVRTRTGAGAADYVVRGTRRSGDPVPVTPDADGGRLVLVTSDGGAFTSGGILFVDAELRGPPAGRAAPPLRSEELPANERFFAMDTSTLWRLALWLQVLLAVVLVGVVAWHRWARPKAWLTLLPAVLLVGLLTAGEAARLLPNLL